jgi:AraC family transcriptional regulator
MVFGNDILTLASRGKKWAERPERLYQISGQALSGLWFEVHRYPQVGNLELDSVGQLEYHLPKDGGDHFIELRFCLTGNTYCLKKGIPCSPCTLQEEERSSSTVLGTGPSFSPNTPTSSSTFSAFKLEQSPAKSIPNNGDASASCEELTPCLDVFSFRFAPDFTTQFATNSSAWTGGASGSKKYSLLQDILRFKQKKHFVKTLRLNESVVQFLQQILQTLNQQDGSLGMNTSLSGMLIAGYAQVILSLSLDAAVEDEAESDAIAFTCKFLSNQSDRMKVMNARKILMDQLTEPLTIKELSKRVAMNECYLKKGFKEMYGATIFEFYQQQRMEYARQLLYEQNLSVTEVSILLGYSSISHFSTAFKKQTGLKPCELLLR